MQKSVLRWLVRILALDAAIAVAVPLFQSFFDSHATLAILIQQYIFAVIYSNLIGIPVSLVLPAIWARTGQQALFVKLATRGLVVILANLFGCLLAGVAIRAIVARNYDYWTEFRGSFGLALVLSAIAVSFVSMYEAQQHKLRDTAMRLKTKELERERALKLATEARLSSLESRIHPHFLFNTINSVTSLIHEDPSQAEKILVQMAELLRFSLDTAPGGLVPLERELQIVQDYLEIERARFGSRLTYEIHVPQTLQDSLVPPLSIQSLVENSVKYAVGPRGKGAIIVIKASQVECRLRLEVRDDGPGFAGLELPAGHGLNNLQERILALFGETAKLEISRDSNITTVAIVFPHRAAQPRLAVPPPALLRDFEATPAQ